MSFEGTIGFITKITPATATYCQIPSVPGFPIYQDERYVVKTEYDHKRGRWMLTWIDDRVKGAYEEMVIGSLGEDIPKQFELTQYINSDHDLIEEKALDAEFHVVKILPLPRERINLGEHGFYLTNFKNVCEQEPMVDLTMSHAFTDLPTLPSKIKKDLKDDIENYYHRYGGENSFSESKVLKILRRLHLNIIKNNFFIVKDIIVLI